MKKNLVLEKLKELIRRWNNTDFECIKEILLEIEGLLLSHLKSNPDDVDILIKLALAQYTKPLIDEDAAISNLKKALCLNPNSVEAVLILAYVEYHTYAIEEDTLAKLERCKADNPQEKGLLCFMQALYYDKHHYFCGKYKNEYGKLLVKSLEFYPESVWPNVYLARFYKEESDFNKAYHYYKLGLDNVKLIFENDHYFVPTDANAFLNQYVKGIHMSKNNYEILQDNVIDCYEHMLDQAKLANI